MASNGGGDIHGSFGTLREMLCPSVDVPCRLLLSGFQVARIIGKNGAFIKELREESGAVVNILDKQLPAAFVNRDERVVFLRGKQEAIQTAVGRIIRLAFGAPVAGSEFAEEHQRAIEVMIPEASCSHLIGEKGVRISSMMDQTKCDLHIVREPVSGLAEQKRIRITGPTLRDVEAAVCKVQELLVDLTRFGTLTEKHFDLREGPTAAVDMAPRERGKGSGIAVYMMMEKADTAWVIGKRGSKINKLRELARVSVNDAEVPPFNPNEAILEIGGAPLSELIHVLQMVLDDLMVRPEASNVTRFMVPTEHFGAVIGRGGEVVSRIASQTGAQLRQHPPERHGSGQYRLRVLEIEGSERQRVAAAAAVYVAVEVARAEAVELGHGPEQARPAAVPRGGPALRADYSSACGPAADGAGATLPAAELRANDGWGEAPAVEASAATNWGLLEANAAASAAAQVGSSMSCSSLGVTAPGAAGVAEATSIIEQAAHPMAGRTTCTGQPEGGKETWTAMPTPSRAPSRNSEVDLCQGLEGQRSVAAMPASGATVVLAKSTATASTIASWSSTMHPAETVAAATPGRAATSSELFLLLPSMDAVRFLASSDLGIGRRSGTEVTAGSAGGEPVLRVAGPPAASAAACYLVQQALWMRGACVAPSPALRGRCHGTFG